MSNENSKVTSDELFFDVAGLDTAKCKNVRYHLIKMGQDLNNMLVAEIFSPTVLATASRTELTPGLVFDMSRSCCNWKDQVDTECLWKYVHTERSMLVVGSPTCKAFMKVQSMDHTNLEFTHALNAEVGHLKALIAVHSWQIAQERWFLFEYLHHKWSWNVQEMRALTNVLGFQLTATKQFGTFLTNCNPIVEELVALIKD